MTDVADVDSMVTNTVDHDQGRDTSTPAGEEDAWIYKVLLHILEIGKVLQCNLCKRFLTYVAEHILRNNHYALIIAERGVELDEAMEIYDEEYKEAVDDLIEQLRALLAIQEIEDEKLAEKAEKHAKSRVETIAKLVVKESGGGDGETKE